MLSDVLVKTPAALRVSGFILSAATERQSGD